MAAGALGELYAHFVSRTNRLADVYKPERAAGLENVAARQAFHRDSRLYCVIRLQHLWGEFCRELVTRSSIGGVAAIGGTRLPGVRGVRSRRDVERIARESIGGRRKIAWHVPERVVGIARELSPANESQIADSLAVAGSPAPEIRIVRNYLVHPNADTWIRYDRLSRELGVFDSDPDALLTANVPQRDVTRFEYWVIRLQGIALDAAR